MTSAWRPEKNEGTSLRGEAGAKKTPPKRPLNLLALVSLLIGSVALIWASLPFLNIVALILGGVGLVAGLLGLSAYSRIGAGRIWSIIGISASLIAACLGAFALIKAGKGTSSENQLTQVPLRNPMNRARPTGGEPKESDWVDAGTNAVQNGDVRVRMISITVGPVDFKEGSGSQKRSPTRPEQKRPREKYLVIKLRISNAGAGQLIQYISWSHPSPQPENAVVSLQDAGGKQYPLRVFPPGRDVVGQVINASIPPSKWVDDILVFEGIPDRVEYLRLELPAESVGSKGSFRLQIPGRMIASR